MSKLSRDSVSRLLSVLIALAVAGLLTAVYLVHLSFQNQHRVEEAYSAHQQHLELLNLVADLHRSLGYVHFIHNFKNAVLRHDEARLDRAQGDMDEATALVARLPGLDPEMTAEATVLRDTFALYAGMIPAARAMIRRGETDPRVLDALVKVDDGPADAAFDRVRERILAARAHLSTRQAEIYEAYGDSRQIVLIIAAGLVAASVAMLAIYFILRLRARSLTETMSHLDRMARVLENGLASLGADPSAGPAPATIYGRSPVRLEQGVANLVDYAERQQAKLIASVETVRAVNDELNRFAYVASHDLQEPLRKIQSNIDIIHVRHDSDLAPGLRDRFDRISRSAAAMRRLIDDLLAYSRAGTSALNWAEIDLARLTETCVREALGELDDEGSAVTIDIAGGLTIEGDRTLLRQALMNLLGNAAKYAHADRPLKVAVSARRDGDRITLWVSDNGIGFEPHYAETIFEPFRRLHAASEYPGSGIGLSIVKRAAQRHGGTVAAVSEGEGATFVLTLPVCQMKKGGAQDANP